MKTPLAVESGFTIIEVILFLAISSLMIITAMTAVSGRTRSVQYRDATISTEAFFDRRISQVLGGSITGDAIECRWTGSVYVAGPNDGSCIFLGYVFRFDPAVRDQFEVIQMYGRRLGSSDPCFLANPGEPLKCVNPTPVPIGSVTPIETFEIPWQMEVKWMWVGGDNTGDQYFGYLRNPIGQDLIPVGYGNLQGGALTDDQWYGASSLANYNDDFSAILCMTDQHSSSMIIAGSYERQYSIETLFDEAKSRGCSA